MKGYERFGSIHICILLNCINIDTISLKQVEITPDMVKKTAELAQIQVTDEEASKLETSCVCSCSCSWVDPIDDQ